MSQWPSIKAKRLLAALFGIGCAIKPRSAGDLHVMRHYLVAGLDIPFVVYT